MVDTSQDIRLPEAQHAVPARSHVRILRGVEAYAPRLSRVRHVKLVRVEVPVIAVELNDETDARHERINSESTAYEVLPEVDLAGFRKDLVADGLDARLAPALLLQVHREKLLSALRVGVPTGERAVLPVCAGRRRQELAAAHATPHGHFRPGCPFVRVFGRAEVPVEARAVLRDVDAYTAHAAPHRLSGGPFRLRRRRATDDGAEALLGAHVAGLLKTAPRATDGPDAVAELSLHHRSLT